MTPKRAYAAAVRRNTGGRITAILGPTNTGKTHFAIERMLAHRSGMIGLPLRLPRRSAVVTFSADDVYGLAELVRRQRGGATVVLGALSPRTRNAQVALYQSGDVDFLVATDAIGMGINMDVDHVAFSALEKFDGVGVRPLRPEEIGQIAGRAGRHMNAGTFCVTAEPEALHAEPGA